MRKTLLTAFFCLLALCLCGCSATEQPSPDVRLLERPVYAEEVPASTEAARAQQVLRLDLWLDASHTMGGINLNEDSMYPHHSRKYREGGFHYRYDDTVGQYEMLLRCMLATAEGSRVRLLRYGSERLTDAFLEQHFETGDLRSLRRDMLTFAIDPMPTVFSGLSGEKMDGSFYQPGTPMLAAAGTLPSGLMENPHLAQQMQSALETQVQQIAQGSTDLLSIAQDADYPLLYALDNLDLTRLSVITCDPASIRKTTAMAADGTPVDLIAQLLQERGVFDAGLSVGLYAFTLDYTGQLSSFSTVDFSEPLVWGHLKYNTKKARSEGVLPMPRTLLTLVVGTPGQVEAYTAALNETLAQSTALQGLRGPENGELSYTRDGQTITQQPFSFAYEYLQIDRPVLAVHTQHTHTVTLGGEQVDNATRLVTLPAQGGSTFSISLPLEDERAELTGMNLSVEDSLTLTQVLANTPQNVQAQTAQTIALRDKLYVYEHTVPDASPFSIAEVTRKDGQLVFTLQASDSLAPGYYHVNLSADYAASLSWETPAWVTELSCTFDNEQISQWEQFSQLMTRYERKRDVVARAFQHAWGPATDALYHGVPYPDFPPVSKAPQLSSLVSQFQTAATVQQTPCVRYTFDVFAVDP